MTFPQIPLMAKLFLVGALLASIIGGMGYIYHAGETAQKARDDLALSKALQAEALARAEDQKRANEEAEKAKQEFTKQLALLKGRLANAGKKPDGLPALPADCKFDQKRIDWANEE